VKTVFPRTFHRRGGARSRARCSARRCTGTRSAPDGGTAIRPDPDRFWGLAASWPFRLGLFFTLCGAGAHHRPAGLVSSAMARRAR
jgi:hypothetical protein